MKKQVRLLLSIADGYVDNKVQPPCPHAGVCGGCLLQQFDYGTQLLIKREYCNAVLKDIAVVQAVEPSMPFGYRNRMDYVCAFGKTGLRKRGSWRHVVDVEDCFLLQQKSRKLYKAMRALLSGIEDYDYCIHKGYLRYVVIRQAFTTEQVMVNFVVARQENNCSEVIEAIYDDVDSISLLLSDGLADLSFGRVFADIKQGYIEERMEDLTYRITPNSFFQANTLITQEMYKEIAQHTYGNVLDMYCGVGSISLFVAHTAVQVTGVELSQEAILNAQDNAVINSAGNVSFVNGDVHDFLCREVNPYDVVIVDPPRSGLGTKAAAKLSQSGAARIIYMSCNPVTFSHDAAELLPNYHLDMCKAYDMFPQTPHLELLAVFNKK